MAEYCLPEFRQPSDYWEAMNAFRSCVPVTKETEFRLSEIPTETGLRGVFESFTPIEANALLERVINETRPQFGFGECL